MSKSYKISLLRFQTPLTDTRGTATTKNEHVFPASPTLINQQEDVDLEDKIKYNQERRAFLNLKKKAVSFDERLRPYQNSDIAFLSRLYRRGIFNQQRTGKTPTTCVCMRVCNENNAIIVAPGSVVYRWEAEYKKWHGGPCLVITAQMNKEKRTNLIKTFKGTVIIPYSIAKMDFIELDKRHADCLVVDEAHRLRNYLGGHSKKTPDIAYYPICLARNIEKCYALTGTPAPNRPQNLYGILALLYPKIFPSYWNFVDYYLKVEREIVNNAMEERKTIAGFQSRTKERELREFLETISVQHTRAEVLPWLKEIPKDVITLPLLNNQQRHYDELHEYLSISKTKISVTTPLDLLTTERIILADPALLQLQDASTKTVWLREFLDDYPEKTVVVVSFFTSYLKLLHDKFPESELYTGETNLKQRSKLETSFNNRKIKLLLAQIDVVKEGIALYGADSMILMDMSLTYTDNDQVMDRLLAISEEMAATIQPQEIIIIKTDTPTDDYLFQMLADKQTETAIINNYKLGKEVKS